MIPPDELHFSRTFAASREAVFRAWTDSQQLADWWGRHDFTNPVCEVDPRAGGKLRIVMRSPEGIDFPLLGTIREMEAPSKLALTFDLSEYPSAWREFLCQELSPADAVLVNEHHLDLAFTEQEEGTRLDLRIRFPSAAVCQAFTHCGIEDGWQEGFDSLAALLSRSSFFTSNTQSQ